MTENGMKKDINYIQLHIYNKAPCLMSYNQASQKHWKHRLSPNQNSSFLLYLSLAE